MPGSKDRANILHQGLLDNMWRGQEATGIALVKHGEHKRAATVYKDALCAFDFCRRPFFEKVMKEMDQYSLVLGHTRSATRGANNIALNAHPFQHGHITLAHNGTIENYYEMAPMNTRPQEINVDSDVVAWKMGQLTEKEDEEKILEQCKGAFAFTWHNARNGTLNIARNDRKPLFFAFVEKENTIIWTSEYSLLVHLLFRRGVKIDGKVKFPSPMRWYTFPLEDLRRFTVRPFVNRPPDRPPDIRRGMDHGTRRTGDGSATFPEPTTTELDALRREVAAANDGLDLEDSESIRSWLRAITKDNAYVKHCGLPTSIKKIQQAARNLKDKGFRFNQPIKIEPKTWRPYKNNKESLGQLRGFSTNGTPVVMYNIPMKTWKEFFQFGKVFVSCVNVRKLEDGKTYLVGMEHPRNKGRMEEFFRALPTSEGDRPIYSFKGPAGTIISRQRFLELAKDGCGNCTGAINPLHHHRIIWLGEPPSPICMDCQEDDGFWVGVIGSKLDDKVNVVH